MRCKERLAYGRSRYGTIKAPVVSGPILDKLTVRDVRTWLNELRLRCQCCVQGKDAARTEPRCCAAGRCYHQVGSE